MSQRLDPDAMLLSGLWGLSRALGEIIGPALRREGISNGGFFVLHLLGRVRSPTVGGCAEKLGIHISGVTHLVNELEEKGLVRRDRSRTDRRVVMLLVTPRGTRALRRVERSVVEHIGEASRRVPRSRKLNAARLFSEIAENLQSPAGQPRRAGRRRKGGGTGSSSARRGVGKS